MVQPETISSRRASTNATSDLIRQSRCLDGVKAKPPSEAPNEAPLLVWRIGGKSGALVIDRENTAEEIVRLYDNCIAVAQSARHETDAPKKKGKQGLSHTDSFEERKQHQR